MLDEGVESRSDGVHRIHWTRIDSDGKVHFSFVRRERGLFLFKSELVFEIIQYNNFCVARMAAPIFVLSSSRISIC